MPDTGAPWNIPYVASTDLVSDWPADSLALANAIDAGLDAAGGLVAVESALFTGTQTNSTAAGASFAVTDLSIAHAMSSASNKLLITAYIGLAGNSEDRGQVGLFVADGGTAIGVGAAASSRPVVGAGGSQVTGTGNALVTRNLSVTFVYEPGDTNSHTYTANLLNGDGSTNTIYVNRTESDADSDANPRGASALVIQEVTV